MISHSYDVAHCDNYMSYMTLFADKNVMPEKRNDSALLGHDINVMRLTKMSADGFSDAKYSKPA
jgi:hypothetical protein